MKTKIKHISLIASLLLALTFIACEVDCRKRGNCPAEYYRYELGEAKDYLWAAKGSYWIYKNSKTGELDTQTCMSSKTYWLNVRGSYKENQHVTIDYEVLTRTIYSTYNDWQYFEKTSFYDPDYPRPYNTYLYINVDGEGKNNPFWYPVNLNDEGGSSGSVTKCINTDTSVIVNGVLFENVIVFEINIDPIWEYKKMLCVRPNTRYYWAKDIGLIKKEMNRCGYSWDLIESQILK